MKQRLIVGLLILGGASLAVFLLSKHPSSSASAPGSGTPPATKTSAPPAPIAVAAPALARTSTVATASAPAKPASRVASPPVELDPELAAIKDFAHWADQFNRGSSSLVEGQRLAWKRREAMLDLIQNDPAQAIALAAPFAWRQSLPPEITRLFEQQLDGRGDFNVAVATEFTQGQTSVYRTVQLGGTNYQAFVYGRRTTESCRSRIPLHGISLDGKMAVSSEPLRQVTIDEASALAKQRSQILDKICGVSGQPVNARNQPTYAESGGGVLCFCGEDHYKLVNQQWALAESGGVGGVGDSGVAGGGAPVNDAWTHGTKTLLYMRVNFPDDLTVPISEDAAYASMDGVNAFYNVVSYNLTALDTTVAPVVTLPQTKAYYSADPGLLLSDARAATKLAGYDTANYDRDIVAFTSVPNYNFGGLAYVGGKGVWLQSMGSGVAAHELGHNYGLWHANFWNVGTNFSMVGPGTNLEYGNLNDTMGVANAGTYQFNAVHKNKLDWIKADAVQVVSTNGIYRIYPFDVPASSRVAGRTYAAAVQKDASRYYWLEFRQLFTSNPWMENGLLVNWAPWPESDGGTQLIDTTPGSPDANDLLSRDDAAITIGRTFNDNPAGVHITPIQRGSTGPDPWIDCQVNVGTFPDNRPPMLQLEVDNTNVAPGDLVHFHATATDPDGDSLAYAWTFDDLTFSTNNLPWTSKVFSTSGDHVVRCVVSDMKGGEASANAVVTVGSPGGFRITGRVTDTNGVPLEGVLVGNSVTTPDSFIGSWTDSDGRFVLVNVSSDLLPLTAFKYGYVFSPTNWWNPYQPTNDASDINFIGMPLPTVSISVDTNSVAENDGTTHYFTLTRTGDTNTELAVNFALSGTATLGQDYTLDSALTSGTVVTIPVGTYTMTFPFSALNDSLADGPETVTVTLLDDDLNYQAPNYVLKPSAEATITIQDGNVSAQPTVTVTSGTPDIAENGIDFGEFKFTRVGSTQNDLLVNYSVAGTALAGKNFVPLAGSVIIPAGQSSASVSVQPLDDHVVDSNLTVVATILSSAGYTVGSPASATIDILNSDLTTVTVFPTREPAAEPSQSGTFTFKRDGDLTDSLDVNYLVSGTAAPGVDYEPLSGRLTIPAGAATADVSLQPIDDGVLTPDKYVTLTVTNDFNYDAGNPGSATVYITEAERPTVSVSAPVNSVSEQGDSFGQFQIVRSTTSGDLAVHLAISGTATPGADYLPLDNPVIIPDGASSVTLNVIPFHDLILESTENVRLTVLADTNYNVGPAYTASVDILDDGTSYTPGVGFCFATSSVVESLSPGIAVSLSVTSTTPVSVDYKVIGGTAPPSRYSLPQGTLVIAKDQVGFVPLKVIDDGIVEPPQTVQVVLFNPTNATLDGIKVHTYTILDDDLGAVSVTATATNASETGRVPGNFRISRTGPTTVSQLVNFQITGTASAPADYTPLGSSVTIPAGALYVDLPVVPADDHTPELTESVVLTLIGATNCAIVSPNVATVTINDNDTNPLPVVNVTSTNQPYAVEGGVNGGFVFTRTGATDNPLTIAFSVSGTAPASRYAALPDSVTIPAGETSVTLPVMAIDDNLVEGEQTVVVSLDEGETYQSSYPSSATVTIQDNDQTVWVDASIFDASKYGPIPGEFTFSRFGTTNDPVTIFYAISGTASNGFDYVWITNSVVIPAGQSSVALPILPRHNGKVEGPVTATLTLLAEDSYQVGQPDTATVTIDDDMPMLTISAVTPTVLEGSDTNGVIRVTRWGDPKYDFTAYLGVGGSAVYGLDYAAFATNIYFTCGVTSIDLFITPSNNLVADGDQTVMASLLPDPAYTILDPSNALMAITDAGSNQTPLVIITNPPTYVAFLDGTNAGLVLGAAIIDAVPTNDILLWSEVSGPASCTFDDTNAANTGVQFTNSGIYQLRLTADNGMLQGFSDVLVFVSDGSSLATNLLHWTFDDGAGTNVADSSGSGRNGVFNGQPAWTTNGVIAGALQFFGTNDCVRQSAGSNTLTGLDAFTVSLWVKPGAVISDRGLVTGDDTGTNVTFSLSTKVIASCGNETNVVEATIPTTAGVVHRASASNALKPGQWQHLALTWTNGEEPKLYINGQLDQPDAGFVAISGVLTNCPQFVVGRGPLDSPASWDGAVDDVRVFGAALSPDEILELADAPVTNHAPIVFAGTNVTVQLGLPVTLSGSFTDDGFPNPPGAVTTLWAYLGTNDVTIADPGSLTNTFVFTEPGDYVFRLMASDGQLTSFSDVTVTVVLPTEVDIYADISDAYELGPYAGEFMLTRYGDTNDLTVYLAISGTASNGVDYLPLTNVVTFTGGADYVTVPLMPILDYAIEGDESVTLTIQSNIAYYIGSGQATVTIHDSPYGLWSIQNFTLEQLTHPNLSGPGADFDHDGIPNFVEYAFNTDPTVPNTPPPYQWGFETDTNDNRQHLTLTYTRRLPPRDVQYGVYVSTDLINWYTGTNYVEEFSEVPDPNGITETVKARALMPFPSTTNLFMNIRVWLEQVPLPSP